MDRDKPESLGPVWPGHADSTEVTRLLTTSVPSLLGRKQVMHLFFEEVILCLIVLVSLGLICEPKGLMSSIREVHSGIAALWTLS